MAKIDTIIVSDIHLGSLVSRAKNLTKLLKDIEFKKLILLGDVFHNENVNSLSRDHWDFILYIKELAKNKQIIWVRGNHDNKIADKIFDLFNIKAVDEYKWQHNNKFFLATHGHKLVYALLDNTFISRIFDKFYLFLQKMDKKNRHIVRFLDNLDTIIVNLSRRIANSALEYAQNLNIDHVFCGHTHRVMQKIVINEKTNMPVHYYNIGCWTKYPSTFAIIDEMGEVELKEI